jgi:hypothetical protein
VRSPLTKRIDGRDSRGRPQCKKSKAANTIPD